MSNNLARIGAVAYILWGLLHIVTSALALWFTYLLVKPLWAGPLADAIPGGWVEIDGGTMAVIRHHSLNVVLFGLVAIVVAAMLNWRNSRTGWLANLVVVGIVDTGFILFLVIPGYIALELGLIGPVLWAIGAILTTIAIRSGEAGPENPRLP